jgi:hypothetical protein
VHAPKGLADAEHHIGELALAVHLVKGFQPFLVEAMDLDRGRLLHGQLRDGGGGGGGGDGLLPPRRRRGGTLCAGGGLALRGHLVNLWSRYKKRQM